MKTQRKTLRDLENEQYEEETDSEDEALQEAFAKGILKPGLNIPVAEKKVYVNDVAALKETLDNLKNNLDWVERLDLISKQAPLPPELAVQMAQCEKQKDTFAYNELKHESLFYRQAQSTVMEAIPRLHSLGVPTRRPDDYFAEMAKSDEHMQKVKLNLIKKKTLMERVEKVRQIRQQKKLQKSIQAQSKVAKQNAKKEMNEEVKKFRKGERKDLGFLDGKSRPQNKPNQSQLKRRYRDNKFGFGGKKRGKKSNTRESTNDMGGERKKKPSGKTKGSKPMRLGKNRRKKMKTKGKK